MSGQRGMTMVELLVGLAIVMLIVGAAGTAYLKLLRTYRTQGRLAQSYMANLTGLEILRYDIETAGFGLPANLGTGATYSEASDGTVPSYNPSALNDAPGNPPRAFAHLNNGGANGSDALAIKSSAANVFNNPTGRKWSMITNAPNIQAPANTNAKVKLWGVTGLDPVMDFTTNEYFIILDNNGVLQPHSGAWGCYTFNSSAWNAGYYYNTTSPPNNIPSPTSSQQVFYIYGLDNTSNNSTGVHRMPFNRVDYYLDNSIAADIPSSCASDTYILYRSTIDQQTGQFDKTPLVDCVKDFQVAFGLDPSGGTNPAQTIVWQDNLAGMNALQIQQKLREVRVFVLFQEGLGDTGATPDFRFSGYLNLGDQDIANSLDSGNYPTNTFQQWSSPALTGHPQLSSFNPSGQDLQYRWKIVEMAVKPMNLMNLGTR
ncbi:MAG TPA: prepilin-type N-terminal cleavage/methylation domain-containing protein [Syntrophobacteraceae bacterium]|nr:prepilin-type N-terminal cleavage/methylation domain-containing protein [Syntrophobacteraceae bacterium]